MSPLRQSVSKAAPPCALLAVPADSPRRAEVERFIRAVFAARYAARVRDFAPNLALIEDHRGLLAAAGWRDAAQGALFLESYLDRPIDRLLTRLAGREVRRRGVVEVGHLASARAGAGSALIRALAGHLERLGFEWVTFTATRELLGILARLGLRPYALAAADPARLGDAARDWGSYYEAGSPVVVAGRLRAAWA